MNEYEDFIEQYGKGTFYHSIDLNKLNDNEKLNLIPAVTRLLENDGVSSYIGGFFWTLDPTEYSEWLNDWLPFDDFCVPFARSAMGDIFFVRQGEILVLSSSMALVDFTTANSEWFFNRYLTDDWFLNRYCDKEIYDKLKDKKLEHDQCFGYTPLLSLGGSKDSEKLEIVQMSEYLDIVSQSAPDDIVFYEY